jgi:tetratricopeptide (TPR) repeat protein
MAELRQLLQNGKHAQAIRGARKILEHNERSVPAMAVMAEAYFRRGDYELCRAVLDAINEQQKNHPLYLYLSGRIYLKEKNYSLALSFFEKAVKKNPKLLDAWTVVGVRHLQAGSYQKALNALLKAKALPGGNTYAMNLNIGSCYRALAHRTHNPQQLVTALNYYNEAEKLYRQSPGHSGQAYLKALYNKAILYLDAKKFPGLTTIKRLEKGIALMKQYVTLAPRKAPKKWAREKKAVMKILNKAQNVELPSAKAMARAKAASQPRPAPRRTPTRRASPRPVPR